MRIEKITSKDNKLVKSIKNLLTDKKYRDSTNLFIAETHKVIETILANKISIRNIVISDDSKYVYKVSYYEKLGINVLIFSHKIFESVSTLKNPDGILAVCYKPNLDFKITSEGKYIILDRLQNPGNLGSIIRTALAFNIDGIIISNDSVDIFNPTIIRNSMGACLSIPIKIVTSLEQCILQLKQNKIIVYGTALNNYSKSINDVEFTKSGIAIIFSNEGNGIKERDLKLCDEVIYIPISNKTDSLNVSVAVGIILHKYASN